jgi:uncharacterized protein GlcG (DUF336 family)
MLGWSCRDRVRGLDRAARLSAGLFAGALLALALQGCGGGGGGASGGGGNSAAAANGVAPPQNLTVADVTQVLTQAGNKAGATPATIAVVDRVGNVLAVLNVNGGAANPTISSGPGATVPPRTVAGPFLTPPGVSLEGVNIIPAGIYAITKAITGAYLSSNGNAFTTRTASQIVQEHFNPLVNGFPGGPLFGVQFSQLPCSDLSTNAAFVAGGQQSGVLAGGTPGPGPHRSPLGLGADPGGFPLYKSGTLVGGIGVIADGFYSLDRDVTDFDTVTNPSHDLDEVIALAGTAGFDAPDGIRANAITVGGQSLRYSDVTLNDIAPISSAGPLPGALAAVPGYFTAGAILAGTVFTQPSSGVVPDTFGDYPGLDAYVLVKNDGTRRFPPVPSVNPAPPLGLSAAEVRSALSSALQIAFRARAQIRRPLNTFVQVTVSVVDLNGNVLGVARTPDAPVFGTDVSLQKARTAMFFSRPALAPGEDPAGLAGYYATTAAFLAPQVTGFPDGHAFSARGIGNLSRPFYPDGIDGNINGPLSLPYLPAPGVHNWSPFADGYQLDVVAGDIVGALGGAVQASPFCGTSVGLPASGGAVPGRADQTRLGNGAQIFAGGVPIYRGTTLIGGLGVSGDGIDQDDMVSYLGTQNSGVVNNAPLGIRDDQLNPGNLGFLRYVNCPNSPFLDSTANNVCS